VSYDCIMPVLYCELIHEICFDGKLSATIDNTMWYCLNTHGDLREYNYTYCMPSLFSYSAVFVLVKLKLILAEWSAQYITTVLCLFYVYCELLPGINSVLVLDDCLYSTRNHVELFISS